MQENNVVEKIIEIIESLRIYINQDGGDVEFLKYENKKVYIKIFGACVGCSAIDFTYKDGLQAILQEEVPEIEEVIIVD